MNTIYLICPTCGEKMGTEGELFIDCPHCGYGVQLPVARLLGLALAAGEEPLPTMGQPQESVQFAHRISMLTIEMSKMLQQLNPKLIDDSAREQMKLFEQGSGT